MADFSDDEVSKMYGNKIVTKVWMAKWDPNRDNKPSEADAGAVKAHLDTKYKSCQWLDRDMLAVLKKHGASAFSKHRAAPADANKPKTRVSAPPTARTSVSSAGGGGGGSADPFGAAPVSSAGGGGGSSADPFGAAPVSSAGGGGGGGSADPFGAAPASSQKDPFGSAPAAGSASARSSHTALSDSGALAALYAQSAPVPAPTMPAPQGGTHTDSADPGVPRSRGQSFNAFDELVAEQVAVQTPSSAAMHPADAAKAKATQGQYAQHPPQGQYAQHPPQGQYAQHPPQGQYAYPADPPIAPAEPEKHDPFADIGSSVLQNTAPPKRRSSAGLAAPVPAQPSGGSDPFGSSADQDDNDDSNPFDMF